MAVDRPGAGVTMSGRKSETVTVPDWGARDAGKRFLITEMAAARAEKWALRMFVALKGTGSEIPEGMARLGIVGVALAGLNVFLRSEIRPEVLEPLLDEMMTCIQVVRDAAHPDVATQLSSDDDIEEVQTRLWLRSEVLRIHTNFSVAEALSRLISATMSVDFKTT